VGGYATVSEYLTPLKKYDTFQLMGFIKFYLLTFFLFFAIDLVWLGVIAKNLYRQEIGFLMTDQIRWGAALVFYLLYILGLVIFVILPSFHKGSPTSALLLGALFGLICYATYDLTNLATLKGWPVRIVIYDLLWGAFISGITSFLVTWISLNLKPFFK